ncbi:MAG: DUF6647 family protein [Bauldia litoralis]
MRQSWPGKSAGFGCALVLAMVAASVAAAESTVLSPTTVVTSTVTLRIGFTIAVGRPEHTGSSDGVAAGFVDAIASWLTGGRGLPEGYRPPRILFVQPRDMVRMRFRDVPSETVPVAEASESTNLVAIYDDEEEVIYLPSDWTGATPVEQSILVHEMVHHLQNLAGARFSCPQEREQAAYAAQAEWLALFGRDLYADFDTDAMTLLVRTRCGF